ncbi:Nucleotide-binding protein, UspA family [Natrarchaeobaculum sulfurireducens]|uniref:Nucleotide-binding protein, UspA family n=1 Tax=Natrarchaeobaculum sulfurireducens TaxID=2044521 RepID=A0A346PA68_9EURY|nr:Nucleotide-binding protein, UspA family [Natrarchaeobaculum sulfurireducens]
MDGSEMSELALEHALEIHPDAELTVLHVVGEPSAMLGKATELALADDLEKAMDEHASAVFDRAQEIAVAEVGEPTSRPRSYWAIPFGRSSTAPTTTTRSSSAATAEPSPNACSSATSPRRCSVGRRFPSRSPVPVTVVR